MPPGRSTWLRMFAAMVIGAVTPYLEIAWKCRTGFEMSEACVWGRSYLPLTRWLEPLLIAPVVFLVLTIIARRRRRRPPGIGSG